MKKIMIRKDFKHEKLEELGYKYSIMEAGYISEDGATIISIDRSPYQRQVMQYRANVETKHNENIEKLKEIGAIEE